MNDIVAEGSIFLSRVVIEHAGASCKDNEHGDLPPQRSYSRSLALTLRSCNRFAEPYLRPDL
ncbi:MAG: hypothetical protein ACKVS6_15535 [Planctomycetota bacterium]